MFWRWWKLEVLRLWLLGHGVRAIAGSVTDPRCGLNGSHHGGIV